MREPIDIDTADICPRCGEAQVEVERSDDRVRLTCSRCEYEVTRLQPSRVESD